MGVFFVPLVVPFFVLSGKDLPKRLKMFLEFVPYTALGASIIPGAMGAIPDAPLVSALGLGFAVAYSFVKGGVIVPVIGSIAVVYMMMLI